MKILMIIDRYYPIFGGSENQLKQLIPYLKELGCEIRVITRRWKKEFPAQEDIDGTPVYRVGWPGTNLISTLSYLAGLFLLVLKNRKSIDVLHTHGAAALGAVGSLLSKIIHKPNVAKVASANKIPQLQNSITLKWTLSLFKQANVIFCLSDEIRRELNNIKTPSDKIFPITNAVDHDRFRPLNQKEKEEQRRRNNLPINAPIIIFCGRLVPIKGVETLFDAWIQISKSHPSTHLLILGSGRNQQDSIEMELKNKLSAGNTRNIHFIGDTHSPEDYFGLADILAFTSKKEGCPNVVLEAMASGLAVVSSDIEGVKKMILADQTGVLFPSGDAKCLANKLIELMNNQNKRESLGTQARQHILENFTFKRIAQQYSIIYAKLNDGRRERTLN